MMQLIQRFPDRGFQIGVFAKKFFGSELKVLGRDQ